MSHSVLKICPEKILGKWKESILKSIFSSSFENLSKIERKTFWKAFFYVNVGVMTKSPACSLANKTVRVTASTLICYTSIAERLLSQSSLTISFFLWTMSAGASSSSNIVFLANRTKVSRTKRAPPPLLSISSDLFIYFLVCLWRGTGLFPESHTAVFVCVWISTAEFCFFYHWLSLYVRSVDCWTRFSHAKRR